jgi:hypothetical protein
MGALQPDMREKINLRVRRMGKRRPVGQPRLKAAFADSD